MTMAPSPTQVLSHAAVATLCGREDECQLLRQAYERSKWCDNRPGDASTEAIPKQELVLIQGNSGTGKTVLAQTIITDVMNKDTGFFLSGKFELSHVRNPYDVFVSAFSELPQIMLQTQESGDSDCTKSHQRNNKIRQAIREAVGADGKLLSDMLPALKDLVGPQDSDDDDDNNNKASLVAHGIEALHRFQYVFSKFVRAISSVVPLVLFFDDLQWSDPSNVSLLQAILESQPERTQQSSLLVICSYRDEDLVEEQPAPANAKALFLSSSHPTHFRDFLEHVTSSALLNVNNISLHNLDEEATGQLVAEYLDVTPELNRKLNAIVFARSAGNPFHAVQLLGPLLNSTPSSKEHQELVGIDEITQTVDEYLYQRLSLLPCLTQEVLQVAACIGDCIDHPALCTIFEGNVTGVERALEASLANGFLVYESKLGQYRFSHDRIRQAALSMIEDINILSFHIGRQLWTKSSPLFLNSKMFVVVNLLNCGSKLMSNRAERYKAAAINLEAGMKAVSLAAFQDAARYFRSGIEFLEGGQDFWNDEYALSLSLFNAAADAELCNQNFERVTYLVDQVLEKGRTMKDKLSAYVVQINSLGQRGNTEAATELGVDVMRRLGEPLPRKVTNATIIFEIVKTRVALRGRSNETLLFLPRMQDETKIACMYVLTSLVPYAFQSSSNYLAVIAARLVRLCLQYGMHKWSANGFSSFGFILCTLNRQEGYRLGQLALAIIERYSGKELLPRVYVSVYAVIDPWIHHLDNCIKPLEHAAMVGMEVGDVEFAMLALSCHVAYHLFKGTSLGLVDLKFTEAVLRMKLMREDGLVVLGGVYHHYIRLLTGQVPLAALNEVWPSLEANQEVDSQLIPYAYNILKAQLAFLFGDLDLAAQMLEKNRSREFAPRVLYVYAWASFVEALICASLVRSQLPRRRRNHAIAKENLKKLTAWAKDCPQNFLHKQHLVEAELLSLGISRKCSSKRISQVQALYDMAVTHALREGFVNEAAMASEFAGDFMSRQGNSAAAHQYWEAAQAFYLEWGATEKAKHLSAKRGTCFSS